MEVALKFVDKQKKLITDLNTYFYMTIPLNLLLWGCESWALTKDLLNKLDVCHMKY